MAQLGRDLTQVLDGVVQGLAVLVSHSMGAMAVMATAAMRPELIGSEIVDVTLLSTPTPSPSNPAAPRSWR